MLDSFAVTNHEHQKADSPAGQHIIEYAGSSKVFDWLIIYKRSNAEKLTTVEAPLVWKRKLNLNSRDEYRGREFPLKYELT